MLKRGEARVGEIRPLDQNCHEGPIEVLGADLDHARVAHRRDVRRALFPVFGEISHLTEALACPQDVQKLLLYH